MFRLLRLKPPHGWDAVAWELAIVTLGVLMALAAQQWADERSWHARIETGRAALRAELSEQYGYAVEFRTVYPCMQAQLEQLRDRVIASDGVLKPAPIYRELNYKFVVRIPSKEYSKEAWEAATNDGIVQRLDPDLRRILTVHYALVGSIRYINLANDESEQGLFALAYPLPLDPTVRFSAVKDIELLSGRLELLNTLNGEAIASIRNAKMDLSSSEARAVTEGFGTYKFCKAKRLPMLSSKEATEGTVD